MDSNNQKLRIDIVSDVVCPWCYIGQARLKEALAQLPENTATVAWKPFQLRPDMPIGGEDKQQFMQEKFGDQAEALISRVEENAKKEGLNMDFDQIKRIPNTVEAHRLMWFAQQEDKDDSLATLLFQAYFSEGRDVEGQEPLLELGAKAGLSADALNRFKNSDDGRGEVQREEQQYRMAGITAVPSFIVNNKYLVQGAQPSEAFLELFQKLSPQLTLIKGEDSCTEDGCSL